MKSQNGQYAIQMITHANPKSPVAEAYRILRTNLNFTTLDRPLKTILITSPTPAEGKSTTLANLAIAVAQAGVETLIVDCDLRKPLQHRIFGVPNARGFTNLLVNREMTVEEVIQDTVVPNLRIMTCGPLPPNPSELLGSKRAGQVIQELEEKFQLVLFDSPPAVAVADASILASQVDGVIMVIRSHVTKNDIAAQAKKLLETANANLIGVVLNEVPVNGEDYYYYYYYGSNSSRPESPIDNVRRSLGLGPGRRRRAGGGHGEEIHLD